VDNDIERKNTGKFNSLWMFTLQVGGGEPGRRWKRGVMHIACVPVACVHQRINPGLRKESAVAGAEVGWGSLELRGAGKGA
jgi:hypothetical protein